jgi:hypothetical protein
VKIEVEVFKQSKQQRAQAKDATWNSAFVVRMVQLIDPAARVFGAHVEGGGSSKRVAAARAAEAAVKEGWF